MRYVPVVQMVQEVEDSAHYRASVTLDEVLGWFIEDGYTKEDLKELAEGRIDTLFEDQ